MDRSAYKLGKDALADAFVATEDKTEVLTVVMQAQLLLGYVVWVSEAEFGHAIETCANAAPPPPTNAFVITAHDWKDFIGSQIEGSIARGSTLSHASETFVDSRASNEDLDAETDLDSVAESDSDPDEEDDSDDSDDDEDDDGDTWPDGEEGSGFDGVAIDDLDGNKQLRPGTVAATRFAEVRSCLVAKDRNQHERVVAKTGGRAFNAKDRIQTRKHLFLACFIQAAQQLSGINALIYNSGTLFSQSTGLDTEKSAQSRAHLHKERRGSRP
ncbi:uncharacterized protein PAN0_016c5218 [Moesziomyces antarcticus]|uniref:Uncharacterized protein n=1 Tax=Pseudozyma antarctica TaxID=84753 RepID=A0A081CJZ7_PSEA2|nr:uncharacterized protein PAN0_016c5218 [Moesziomyces antarcticus]GAK66993.1 hypothetical protein PAN0_016c5218 [Moesziomyces antarcticus]